MTANTTASSFSALLASFGSGLKSLYRLIGRIALGGVAIIAAGIVAMAMAFLGLLIALAALIMRLTRGGRVSQTRTQNRTARNESHEGGIVLEARKTGEGCTVE